MSAFFQFFGNGGPPFGPPNQPIDIVCSEDFTNPQNGVTSSCEGLVNAIGAPMIASGEVAQRVAESNIPKRKSGGPSELANVMTFTLPTRQTVWTSVDNQVTVEAVGSTHIGGHASYRVNTPVGSVVIGGDASDGDDFARGVSTSEEVEALAQGADILVHSAIHPVFGPNGGSTYPQPFYARQSNSEDIGSMADRAGVGAVLLTHMIPSIGSKTFGIWDVPNGGLSAQKWEKSVQNGGFSGKIVAGEDLETYRIP